MKDFFKRSFKGDKIVWMVIIVFFILSMLAVYSSTGSLAYQYQRGNTFFYFIRHTIFLMVGIVITYITHRLPYKIFAPLANFLFFLAIPLLILTLIVGTSRNEAARWLELPVLGIEFQTSDLAKFALIMFVAKILSQNQETEEDLKNAFKPILISTLLICGLILPANFSTAALLFITVFVLMFIGRIPTRNLLQTILGAVICFVFFVMLIFHAPETGRFGTWKHRFETFTSPEKDGAGDYQVKHAKIAIATGGFIGKGPGNSTQRNFLPHPYSDFIFAIIIEEFGSLTGIILLSCYLFILYRAIIIVKKCERTFPAFLAIGLTIILVFQAMINMAVTVNLLPVTGQTLPFISMGGTSILFTSVALGIILSISRTLKQQDETTENEVTYKYQATH